MISVAVVVPVLNGEQTLPYCLNALARLNPAPAQIVLVDNGSSDRTPALLHDFAAANADRRVQVLEDRRRGAAAARNTGIRAATTDLVAFTDADCAPHPAWLRHLVVPFVDPRVGAVAGRVVSAPAASTTELFSALYTLQLPERPARHRRWTPLEGGYPTANLSVRRTLLEKVGGFDMTGPNEDHDLCARLYAHGAEIAYVPEAQVFHHHRGTFSGMVRQAFTYGFCHPYLLGRHASHGLWLELPRRTIEWGACPIKAWVDLAAADKKLLAMLGLGIFVPSTLALPPLYLVWLAVSASRRARRVGVRVGPGAALQLGLLLVVKSFAMTIGRWRGSLKYGVLCF